MNKELATPYNAARLIHKSLTATERDNNDPEHRELMDEFSSNQTFRTMVHDFARGLELNVFEVGFKAIVLAPTSSESKFAYKISDIRGNLDAGQRAGLLIAHTAICAVYFPTSESLENDFYTPPPVSILEMRNSLNNLVIRLKENFEKGQPFDETIDQGWQHLAKLPPFKPNNERAALNSLHGFVKSSVNYMLDGKLLHLERASSEDDNSMYTPTIALKIHLREFLLPKLYELARPQLHTEHVPNV
jgi:hypothetical protein